MNFNAFIEDIEKNNWEVYGVEVYGQGKFIHSYGDTCENIHEIYSATKSVLSIAVGIAYDNGYIDLNKSILDYLPDFKLSKLSREQIETFKPITIKRLLTMSVGDLPFRPESDSYLDFSLSCKINNPKEKVFHYNNISAYLVGVALTTVLGTDVGTFIEDKIFAPLNITRYEYGRCPEGYFYGASAMKLTVHDLSKIGILLYNNGIYKDTRILSEKYVRTATSVQQANKGYGYGYLIWKYKDGFSINGKWGQRCFCLPDQGLIITYMAHMEDNSNDLLYSMERNILENISVNSNFK
jgi:CubicO group peptidase (beta-lactamase class C family)